MLNQAFVDKLFEKHQKAGSCPSPERVIRFFDRLLGLLFPEFLPKAFENREEVLYENRFLFDEYRFLIQYCRKLEDEESLEVTQRFFRNLEGIHEKLSGDVNAMFQGDPAAKSHDEVVRTYPGFYAIAAYRIAHSIHNDDMKLVARMITEHAHSKTGIDIHPAAKIGSFFCIDHGTGVVIGETTVIGDNVKIYQGVTLGGLSVEKKDAAIKRHPSIGDGVVIYAGATILGGKTNIGAGSIIGGNVWLTRSVPENSKVYYKAHMSDSEGKIDTITIKT